MNNITIIGLGPGDFDHLTLEAKNLLENNERLFLRTERHPLVKEFKKNNIEYTSCDKFYEENDNFNQVYRKIAEFILNMAKQYGSIQYAVPGDPLVLEDTVELILELTSEKDTKITIKPALSALDAIYSLLKIHPAKGLIVLDALSLPQDNYWIGQSLLITQTYSKFVASDLKLKLLDYYPPNSYIQIIKAAGVAGQEELKEVKISEMDWYDYNHLTSVYIPKVELNNRFEDLVNIVKKLRGPNGCPWDKEQNHMSLQTALLEETYEVLETIQSGNKENMCEELGDLLLQIAFHSVLANEEYYFSHRDVISGIIKKMIRRHPHVFADSTVEDTREVLKSWEEIKQREKGNDQTSIVGNIPKVLPALLQADKIQRKAARAGFDWDEITEVWNKVYEELEELKEADQNHYLDELGDVLFAVVNLARFLHIDAESALISTINKFRRRFQYIERKVASSGKDFGEYSLNELDKFWELAKKDNI
ncbi:MAG: nucleoside triphosphate pyrophosphohydrolase [Clostridia bacterium]